MVFIFAKTPDAQLASLARELDETLAANEEQKMAAVINFTGDLSDDYQEKIVNFGEGLEHVALTTTADAGKFKVNDDAEVTVMHYLGKVVKFNYATDGSLTDDEIKKIVSGSKEVLP